MSAVINFRYSSGAEFEILLDTGDWHTGPYKRFGITLRDGQIQASIWQGTTQLPVRTLTGSLVLNPATWFTLLLFHIGEKGEFSVQLWSPQNRISSFSIRRPFCRSGPICLGISRQGTYGTMILDDFKVVNLEGN